MKFYCLIASMITLKGGYNQAGRWSFQNHEGEPKWWKISELDQIDMQDDIRERLPLYWRKGSFERIHYWNEEKHCIGETKTILYD